MALQLGDTAPDFQADTTAGPIQFREWKKGSWAVLFSHPADFTPVCTTELGRVAQLRDEWAARGTKTIALSVDSVADHEKWVPDINEVSDTTVEYPIIADPDKSVAQLYGMIHPNEGDTSSVRVVYIIDPADKVRLTLTYPKSVGRNFDEILRALDALQLTDRVAVSTPVDWRAGDRVIVPPTVSTEDARGKFGEVDEVRPYLRFVQVPQG
ncbi:alkyl hydroperoxide reductase subunit AhpC [Actinokineospora baliensis]|uniref:peroxiredoxin n=1 Tax=Actinokineospora baliensis TaxID=547056 RepID=UPI00195B775E|nr:peroxiredoxin [Actinokineospora baliensis]MBM7775591.1 alkyl hydroperoxide reductase subunit AhpC [Actinokineospora baliensis]